MASLGPITYNTIINRVTSWIKSNCSNITNYSDMNSCVKNGYSYKVGTSGFGIYVETASSTMTSSIGSVSANTVDTDMNNYIATLNISSILNNPVTENNFYAFMNNMVNFCSTNVGFVASQADNSSTSNYQYMIYKSGTIDTSKNMSIDLNSDEKYLITASDVNDFFNKSFDSFKKTARVYPCRFTYSLS